MFRPVRSQQQDWFQAMESQLPLCPQFLAGRGGGEGGERNEDQRSIQSLSLVKSSVTQKYEFLAS